MYRKLKPLAIVFLVFLPVVAAYMAGYPLRAKPWPDGSRRCFKVGELNQYITCFKTGRRLAGYNLLVRINEEASSFSFLFPAALCISFAVFSGSALLIALQGEPVQKEKLHHAVDKKKRKK